MPFVWRWHAGGWHRWHAYCPCYRNPVSTDAAASPRTRPPAARDAGSSPAGMTEGAPIATAAIRQQVYAETPEIQSPGNRGLEGAGRPVQGGGGHPFARVNRL